MNATSTQSNAVRKRSRIPRERATMRGNRGRTRPARQLVGPLGECHERCGAVEHDVGGQLHLGHAVAVPRSQCLTFDWTEDRDHAAHPVVTAPLQERRAQAIGSRLERRYIVDGQEGVVGLAETHPVSAASDRRSPWWDPGEAEDRAGSIDRDWRCRAGAGGGCACPHGSTGLA